MALLSAGLLISLSLSGALLLYAKEIQAWLSPQYWQVNSADHLLHQQPLPLSSLVNHIEQETNTKIQFIQRNPDPNKVWQVRLSNKQYLNINPYTGDILLRHSFYDTFYGFIMAWHRWLLYSNDHGERPLQLWVSIACLIFIIEVVIGVYLWLKPKHRLKRLRVRWHAKKSILFHQLHGSLGLLLAFPLILIAFSGISFYWPEISQKIVEQVTFSQIQQPIKIPTVTTSQGKWLNSSLDQAYYNAAQALPTGEVYRIYLPQEPTSALALRIQMPDESHAYSWSWANPYTGDVLQTFNASTTTLATQVWNFRYKFHIGEFIGWPIKMLWLLLSLLPCFFIISGIYLWRCRHTKSKRIANKC